MDRQRFLQFCTEYRDAIEGNLREASLTADADAIHDLRVAIKRMRALAKVFDAIVPGGTGRKRVRKLRDLFRAAGAIRDFQVQQQIVTDHAAHVGPHLAHYADTLRLRQGAAFYSFLVAAEEFDHRSLRRIEKLFDRSLKNTYTVGVSLALNRYIDTLLTEITAKWPPRNLHPLRMITKEADNSLYVIEMILPSMLVEERTHEILGKMQALLGLWQDHNVAIGFSRDYEPLDEHEHAAHRKFRREVRRERRQLKDQIFALWCELRKIRGMDVVEAVDLIPPGDRL